MTTALLTGTRAISAYMKMDWRVVKDLVVKYGLPARQAENGTWYSNMQAIDEWAKKWVEGKSGCNK